MADTRTPRSEDDATRAAPRTDERTATATDRTATDRTATDRTATERDPIVEPDRLDQGPPVVDDISSKTGADVLPDDAPAGSVADTGLGVGPQAPNAGSGVAEQAGLVGPDTSREGALADEVAEADLSTALDGEVEREGAGDHEMDVLEQLGAGDPLTDPFQSDPGDVPAEYDLSGNEAGDGFLETMGNWLTGSDPFSADGPNLDLAGNGPVAGSAPPGMVYLEGSGYVTPATYKAATGEDPPDDDGETTTVLEERIAATQGGGEEDDNEPDGSPDPAPAEPSGEGGDPDDNSGTGDDGEGSAWIFEFAEALADQFDETEDMGADSQTFGRSPSMDPEIGETYFGIGAAADAGSEVQYADTPESGGGEPIDYDGIDYGEDFVAPDLDLHEAEEAATLNPFDDPAINPIDETADDSGDAADEMIDG